ncbi:MAG: anti-sigma factor family protein, partial [Janthinobacterium lividum]
MTNFMLNCTQYEDDLKAYLDGELSWLRRQAIRRHLTHCASCQKEILEMTQIAEDLRSAEPTEALSPALREKLLGVEPTPSRSSSTLPPLFAEPRQRVQPGGKE